MSIEDLLATREAHLDPTTPREDAIAALRAAAEVTVGRFLDTPASLAGVHVAALNDLRDALAALAPADPTADPEEAAFDAETAALHDWLTLAVEHMDAKVQPERYRPDGTIDRYSIDDTTWHRVLAIARGQVSDNAKRVLTANADAFFARRAALAAMRETIR